MRLINRLLNTLGIDGAILYTSSARIIQAGGGIITLLLIAKFLTSEEQGYYYTFGSILSMQIFFELGFNGILTQYVAHENANIKSYIKSDNDDERRFQSRLSSLLHIYIKWYSFLSVLALIVLLISGFYFFNNFDNTDKIQWRFPWVVLTINAVITFFFLPLLSIIEGLGFVKEIAKYKLVYQFINMFLLWVFLSVGAKLYSASFAGICSFLVLIILVWKKFRTTLIQIWNLLGEEKISYKLEIFPYQWKMALSGISGFFIFQLFNPVVFANEGAVVAGQMGMSLTLLNAIQNLSMSWINTKVFCFSELIALRRYFELDRIFNKVLKQSVFISGFLLALVFITIFIFRESNIYIKNINIADRFLDYKPMFFLALSLFLNQFVFSWATYLRCHKREPYMWLSIITAVLCLLSTFLLGNIFGVLGITFGYFIITIGTFVSAFIIYHNKKKDWH